MTIQREVDMRPEPPAKAEPGPAERVGRFIDGLVRAARDFFDLTRGGECE